MLFRAIPIIPMVLVPGASFRAGDLVAPLYGLVLGSFYGVVAITIGTIVSYSFVAPVFLGLDFLPAATSAAIVGLLLDRKRNHAILLYATLLVLFISSPFTAVLIPAYGILIPYNWLHLIGFAVLLSPIAEKSAKIIRAGWAHRSLQDTQEGSSKMVLGMYLKAFVVLALIGTLAQHLTGGLLTEIVFGLNFHSVPRRFASWQAYWTVIFWLYPVERAIIAIGAALLSAPVIVSLTSSRITRVLSGRHPSLPSALT